MAVPGEASVSDRVATAPRFVASRLFPAHLAHGDSSATMRKIGQAGGAGRF
jgi:hypothetical protein